MKTKQFQYYWDLCEGNPPVTGGFPSQGLEMRSFVLSLWYTHHYHHYADLSEGTELLKCLPDIFCLECVSKIRSVLSMIFHAIYGTVFIQLTHFSYDDCENTYTWSIIIKSEVWPICHCLRSGNETMVCAVCLSIFLWGKHREPWEYPHGCHKMEWNIYIWTVGNG